MSRRNILITAVVIVALLALVSLLFQRFSPPNIAHYYTLVLQAIALFLGFVLALRVANIYNKDLKKSFLFLSLFLLFYTIKQYYASVANYRL